jgi:hypothetical protein
VAHKAGVVGVSRLLTIHDSEIKLPKDRARPLGITALIILFVIGTVASLISALSLTFPGCFLEPIWHVNPQAREAFTGLGGWAIALMSTVCAACLCAAIGLWRKRNWGYWLAVGMLCVNMAGSAVNVISGTELRAIVGIPIVLFLLGYLARPQIRKQFH